MATLRFVLGDQLHRRIASLADLDPETDVVLMVEVREEATYVRHHKQKIAFLFSAMRHFAAELEREGVVYVRRGQGTFVAPDAQPDREERRALAVGVARRALLDARRNGLGVDELLLMIREVAAEEEGEPSPSAAVLHQGDQT